LKAIVRFEAASINRLNAQNKRPVSTPVFLMNQKGSEEVG
jgi:hypothetical protein